MCHVNSENRDKNPWPAARKGSTIEEFAITPLSSMSQPSSSRRRDAKNRPDAFVEVTPWTNAVAVYGYRCAVYGIIPIVGLVLGPLAFIGGLIGRYRYFADPSVEGRSQARAAIVLGAIETVFNAAGVGCIAWGLSH